MKTIRGHKLSKSWLIRLLDAREGDFKRTSYHQTTELENYCESTFGSLLCLTLEALGKPPPPPPHPSYLSPSTCFIDIKDVNADHAASHIGKAQGIVTILRASGYYRSRRQVLIPLDILMRV